MGRMVGGVNMIDRFSLSEQFNNRGRREWSETELLELIKLVMKNNQKVSFFKRLKRRLYGL